MRLRLIARAKINLSLHVVGTATDGYHEIRTVMQSVDLADDLHMTRSATTNVEIEWAEGSGPLPSHPDLVERALAIYVALVSTKVPILDPLRITVPGRKDAKGPTVDLSSTVDSLITAKLTSTPSPI